jgi:hypothetical protein
MKKILYIAFVLSFLFFPALSRGAEISAVSESKNLVSGEKFQVDFLLDTQNESLNAFAGSIAFPKKLLSLPEVSDGNSIVNFWIEKPKENTASSTSSETVFSFSGITPGGYVGSRGPITSFVFTVLKTGSGTISVRDAEVLKNDGKGTAAAVSTKDFSFIAEAGNGQIPAFPAVIDTDPPENFTPTIAKDPNIFDNQWFVAFATQDKGSGIDHYEIAEKKSEWIRAESPYLLRDQSRSSDIYVKAVDKAGNERIAVIHTAPILKYIVFALLAILLLIAVALYRRAKRARS